MHTSSHDCCLTPQPQILTQNSQPRSAPPSLSPPKVSRRSFTTMMTSTQSSETLAAPQFSFRGWHQYHWWAILAILQVIQPQSPPNVPLNGNALWYQNEAINWVREYLPIGNRYLGGESFCSISIPSSFTEMAPFGSHGIRWCDFQSIVTQY